MSNHSSQPAKMSTSCWFVSCPDDPLILISKLCDDLCFFRALLLTCKRIHLSLCLEKTRRTRDILGVELSQCQMCNEVSRCDSPASPTSLSQPRTLLFLPFFAKFANRLRNAGAWIWSLSWTTMNTFNDGLDLVVSSHRLNETFYPLHAYWIALCQQRLKIELSEGKSTLKSTDLFEHNCSIGSHPNVLPPTCRPNAYSERQCANLYRLKHYLINTVRLIEWMCNKSVFGETGNDTTLLQKHLSLFCDALNHFFDAYKRQPIWKLYELSVFDYATTGRWIVDHSSSPFCLDTKPSKISFEIESESDSESTSKPLRKKMRIDPSSVQVDREALVNARKLSRMSHSQKEPYDHTRRRLLRRFRL